MSKAQAADYQRIENAKTMGFDCEYPSRDEYDARPARERACHVVASWELKDLLGGPWEYGEVPYFVCDNHLPPSFAVWSDVNV